VWEFFTSSHDRKVVAINCNNYHTLNLGYRPVVAQLGYSLFLLYPRNLLCLKAWLGDLCRQPCSFLCPSSFQNLPPPLRRHPLFEAMVPGSFYLRRLKGSFHLFSLFEVTTFYVIYIPFQPWSRKKLPIWGAFY
jgi:hypothetical protein